MPLDSTIIKVYLKKLNAFKRDSYEKIVLLFLSLNLFFSVIFGTWFIRSTKAEPGSNFLATVLYADGYPREGAYVRVYDIGMHATDWWFCGMTNATGHRENNLTGLNPDHLYKANATYPDGVTLFGYSYFVTDGDGDGVVTIAASYEITPPVIEILSPQNLTYATTSVPLTFTVDDYSPISWMGYSLDNQPNVTITGNTTLAGLAFGSHNVIVYANDTYGNMGSSDSVHFKKTGCVTVKVEYADGYPRSGADILVVDPPPETYFGTTGEDGTKTRCDFLEPGDYVVRAEYAVSQFGPDTYLHVNGNGDGSTTITDSDHKSIEIHSPENTTYYTGSVPLNFTFQNSSVVSWTGYSLDDQMNVTISGNTIMHGLANGPHSVIIYANDTNSYMGYSDPVSFTVNVEHDIAVTNVTLSKTIVCQGYNMNINATVQNLGRFPETFNVTAYANTTEIGTQTVNNMPNGTSTVLFFTWNTNGFAIGNYTISANATIVTNETETDNNSFTDDIVRVTIPGDIAKPFGVVNILDILYVAVPFGFGIPESRYDPIADIDNNGVINILDILIIAVHFGETV